MKQKIGRGCGVACCILLACGDKNTDGPPGVPLETGALLVTEIMADPQGIDTEKEYIEIHNPNDTALSLNGLELFVIPGSSGKEKSFALPAVEIPPGAYWTLGDVSPEKRPPHIDIGYDRALGALPNTSATVGLRNINGSVVDSVYYTSTKAGRSLSRQCLHVDSQQCPSEEAVWCFAEADMLYDAENYGSPQKPNAACQKDSEQPFTEKLSPGTCLENGVPRDIRVPQPGQLILNELMISPGADLKEEEAEWVELWAMEELDFNNLELKTRSRSQKTVSANCLPIKADGYVLLALSLAPEANGCLHEVDWRMTVRLPNSSPADNRQSLTLYANEEILDTVVYPSAPKARSYQRDPETQKWCYVPTSTPFYDICRGNLSGNRGTPKGDNVSCP